LDALALADIHKGRANRTQNFKLLKYMFNDMTGGVALSRRRSEGAGVVKQVRAMLMRLGFPHNLFDIRETPDGVLVKPLRYLGDDWKELNLSLRQLAGKWLRGEGGWILPYLRRPQLLWRYRRTWHRRRLQKSIASKIATNCHISSREAISEVLPLLKEIFRGDKQMAVEIAAWLKLEDREAKWLIS
jgi:hypothetical protein